MSAQILLIDNYDSFTYNLVQYLRMLGAEVLVHRNDALGMDEALALNPSHLVVSPGPGVPRAVFRTGRSRASARERPRSFDSIEAFPNHPREPST